MTYEEFKKRQSWSLEQKIDHAIGTIEDFISKLGGVEHVYVSFSGGKDSTVLYWLARKIYPDIKAVFINTGNEFPDIVKFVRKMKNEGMNIDIIYPKLKPNEVIAKVGFPLLSKQRSRQLRYMKHHPESLVAKRAVNAEHSIQRVPDKYMYLAEERFDVSDECCNILKKEPAHDYMVRTKRYPILGTMACESKMREQAYLKAGQCNVFNNRDKRRQHSQPLAIWTEEDIYQCIEKYNIEVCDIYNKGVKRTGCVFCGFGVQLRNDTRLKFLYDNYPKWYSHVMSYENHGVTYREALRTLLKKNKITLPDEEEKTLFD